MKKRVIKIVLIVAVIVAVISGSTIGYFNSLNKYSLVATPTGMSVHKEKSKEKVTNADFYVATNGNDSANGTFDNPFKTPERAKNAVSQLIANKTDKEKIVVAFFGGEYQVDNLSFTENDCFNDGRQVIYTSYNEEKVTFNGGKTLNISDFENVNGKALSRLNSSCADKIMCVDLGKYNISENDYGKLYSVGAFTTSDKYDGDHTGAMQTELFFNGERMNLAQYPNKSDGYLKISSVQDVGDCHEPSPQDYHDEWLTMRNPKGGTFTVDTETKEKMNSWKTLNDVWLFGYFYWDWADMSTTISNYDNKNGQITTTYCSKYGFQKDANFYFYNALEELDETGEYYIDREENVLYIYNDNLKNTDNIQITLSTNNIIDVNEKSKNITFDGLSIQGTRGNGISFMGDSCTFANGEVKNVAGDGAIVKGKNNIIRNSEISRCGKNGVFLGNEIIDKNGNDIRANGLISENNLCENNSIHDYGEIQKTYTSGVSVHGVNNKASHNEIYNAPHMGIFFEGNNNVIEYNNIHNVVKLSSDAGAIYGGRNLSFYNNAIRYNCIYNIGSGEFKPSGIYLDDGLAGETVYGNLLVNIPGYGILIGGGRDNLIDNNMIINSSDPIEYDARLYEGFHNNGWYSSKVKTADSSHWLLLKDAKKLNDVWGNIYPEINKTTSDFQNTEVASFALNPNSTVSNNVVLSKKGDLGEIAKASKKYGDFQNNYTYKLKDIGFSNFENGDYNLSEQLDGFKEIPVSKIGRY